MVGRWPTPRELKEINKNMHSNIVLAWGQVYGINWYIYKIPHLRFQ